MIGSRKFSAMLAANLLLVVIFNSNWAFAGPIYVIREAGGVIRFTNKPPAPGVKSEVFTARGVGFSSYGRGYWGSFSLGKLNSHLYAQAIDKSAKAFGVAPSLIKAMIHVESGFNRYAVSPKGAQGLMQLMPETARQHGLTQPFEPLQNIQAGTKHIADLIKKYSGNLTFALAAYNAGEDAVGRYGGIPPFAETKHYVRRVEALMDYYERHDTSRK